MGQGSKKDTGTPGHLLEVLIAFLGLGLTAFGGPVAHLGYFREAFVKRRQWLDAAAYADLVALCQFLPGPASSQVGFAIGWRRAGFAGGLAAWIGFTLPSALLMTAFAFGVNLMTTAWAVALIHGLKLVAVAVVAQAVWGMARSLTPDVRRTLIAAAAFAIVTFGSGNLMQVAAISMGALAGLWLCRDATEAPVVHQTFVAPSRATGLIAMAAFFILLLGLPLAASLTGNPAIARFDAFYRSGALVFGGGHVVLPLLQQATVTPGWISQDSFLAGYGVAQALPGPLFTFAAFLGAGMHGAPNGVVGATAALIGIFLPGLLALIAALPFWAMLQTRPMARSAMRGANAGVVGLLAAALYNPVWTSTIKDPYDIGAAAAGFLLLTFARVPPLIIVILGIVAGLAKLWI